MSTTQIMFVFLSLVIVLKCQVANLTFQVLSQGQNIQIPLEDYFEDASSAQIIDEKSTHNYRQVFEITNSSSQSLREVFTVKMQFNSNGTPITLSKQQYYTVKSIYNQPAKLFLLKNNFLMLLTYSQLCGDEIRKNNVTGFNLSQNLPLELQKKKITCTSMETQSIQEDFAYVVCRVDQQNRVYSYFVQEINLLHNLQGFIQGLRRTNVTIIVKNTSSCTEYNLKYFETMKINSLSIPSRIFMFCKKLSAISSNEQGNKIYYFYSLDQGFQHTPFKQLFDCLTNSSYASPTDNGFMSVINKKMWEYTTTGEGKSSCTDTTIKNINYQFAASRTYNNIQITYFFLLDNSVMIKTSYRTNYQKLIVNCTGFYFTSYALTERFMAITLSNLNGDTRLFIYEMEELFPRLIDDRLIEKNETIIGNFLLLSTSNYLEKGSYVFFYNNATNELSLKQYNGFVMTIRPKSTSLALQNEFLRLQRIQEQKNKNKLNQKNQLMSYGDSTPTYKIYIQCNSTERKLSEYMLIYISIRKFNDWSLYILPIKPLSVDSSFVNFNLSGMAFGPLQRYYLQDNMSDHNIHLQFINYFNTINIADFLNESTQNGGLKGIEKVKQIALNLQLKVLYPVFTMYYSTFIQNCILRYIRQNLEFKMECHPEDVIRIKSSIQFNQSKILVLSKDKWLQYSNQSLQYCSIVGEQGLCQQLSLKFKPEYLEIKRIKLVKFESKSNTGFTLIQVFVICNKDLYYGQYRKVNTNQQFVFNKIFSISQYQVLELTFMRLNNIHFDKNYNNYLLLHLSLDSGDIVKHVALLYDHPPPNRNGKFLGHLIRKFDDEQIQSIMTIDNLLIILYQDPNLGTTIIRQYKITSVYSVYETRIYPLFGRKIIKYGAHVSDGEFLYIETESLTRKDSGKTDYLVFCPTLSTINILTHVIPKQSAITFLQEIGGVKTKYPHSIGIHGKNIFALSLPNLVLKFDYDVQKGNYPTSVSHLDQSQKSTNLAQFDKNTVSGNLNLKIVDYHQTLHEIIYKYQFDISAQIIEYTNENQKHIQVNSTHRNSTYILETNKIVGPVMSINLTHNCSFLNNHIQFQDVLTKLKCLIDIDSKKYGALLDMTYISFGNNKSVELFLTTQHFLCAQNREISEHYQNISISKACSFVSFQKNNGLFVCDEGSGTIIYLYSFENFTCEGLSIKTIQKPTWLIYQYFKMKFMDPFVIFEVPIRVETNRIYFLTTFNLETYLFEEKFSSITYDQYDDNFQTKDIEVSQGFLYLLEDGLGIYDLREQRQLKNAIIEPTLWLTVKQIQQSLKASAQIVYIKPKKSILTQLQFHKCPRNATVQVQLQIGTTSHAYQSVICFGQDTQQGKYEIIPYITYKQYKDCKNNVLSKSKYYNQLTIKLCILEMSEYRIFSNFMPITPKSSEYYIQFYSVDMKKEQPQTIYPFRMEKISTNDTFEIKVEKGELIIRSLFNFICYYRLTNKVRWTLHRQENFKKNEGQAACNATLTLRNENYIKNFPILIKDTDPDQDPKAYIPWIYRSFFMAICIISLIKLRIYIKNKNIKLNKMKYNLMSNEFEFQVRLNSKKQIEPVNNPGSGSSQSQILDQDSRYY